MRARVHEAKEDLQDVALLHRAHVGLRARKVGDGLERLHHLRRVRALDSGDELLHDSVHLVRARVLHQRLGLWRLHIVGEGAVSEKREIKGTAQNNLSLHMPRTWDQIGSDRQNQSGAASVRGS